MARVGRGAQIRPIVELRESRVCRRCLQSSTDTLVVPDIFGTPTGPVAMDYRLCASCRSRDDHETWYRRRANDRAALGHAGPLQRVREVMSLLARREDLRGPHVPGGKQARQAGLRVVRIDEPRER